MNRSTLIFLFLFLFGGAVRAESIDDAFNALLGGGPGGGTITNSGKFKSQFRTNLQLGGMDVRYPRKYINLVTVQAPTVNAGCGGISAHFGGISYVDGDEIIKLLKNIAQNAKGYVFELALTQLCQSCAKTLKDIQEMIQKASKFGIDSCQMSKNLVNGFVNSFTSARHTECSIYGSEDGSISDFLQGQISLCETDAAASAKLDAEVNSGSLQEQSLKKERTVGIFGNSTWQFLLSIGLVDKNNLDDSAPVAQLFMSMLGTNLNGENVPPTVPTNIAGKAFTSAFLCGWNFNTLSNSVPHEAAIKRFCEDAIGDEANKTIMLLSCNGDFLSCDNMVPVSFFEHGIWDPTGVFQSGFMIRVATELQDAIQRAKTGQPFSDFQAKLIEIAPFPLYKIINTGIVYPEIAEEMVQKNAIIISLILTDVYWKHLLEESFKSTKKDSSGKVVANRVADKVRAQVKDLAAVLDTSVYMHHRKINSLITEQKAIMAQVKEIDRAIMSDLFARGLGGALIMSNQLN